jgi:methyl-accepting chemotaxis protein
MLQAILQSISIAKRIYLGFGFLIALMAIGGFNSARELYGLGDSVESSGQGDIHLGFVTADMRYRLLLLRRYEKDAFLNIGNAEKVADYKEKWEKAAGEMDADLKLAMELARDEKTGSKLRSAKDNIERYKQGFAKVYQRLHAGEFGTTGDANRAMSRYEQSVHDMEEQIQAVVEDSSRQADAVSGTIGNSLRSSAAFILGAVLFSVAVAGVFAFVLARSITQPLNLMQNAIAGIAKTGDLSQGIPYQGKDEIGQTATAFDTFLGGVRKLVSETQANSSLLKRSSNDVNTVSRKVLSASDEQSEAASSTAASVEQMVVSISMVADHAKLVEQDGAQTRDHASTGVAIADEATKEIDQTAIAIGQSADMVASLNARSNEIGSIVKVIKEIADQTNLLALNAAIEAARAGEQGRGFAVVADEVRKLAERTARATAEISQMIDSIHGDTTAVVDGMEAAKTRVSNGVTLNAKVVAALQDINRVAEETAVKASEIARAIAEQSAASNQIARNVEKIAQMTEENTLAVKQAASSADELHRSAERMDELVRDYRV